MSNLTFKDLPQLQAFIFSEEALRNDVSPGMLHRGFGGASLLIKLSNTCWFTFQWPFPDKKEEMVCQVVDPKKAGELVIPLAPPVNQAELHAAIAKIGLGHRLINLKD